MGTPTAGLPPINIPINTGTSIPVIWGSWFRTFYLQLTTAPKLRAYLSVDQSISNNTITKVAFDSVTQDLTNMFDAITNHRATPAVAATYKVSAAILWATTALAYTNTVFIYVNGAPVTTNTKSFTFIAGTYSQAISDEIVLKETDYVEVWVKQTSGVSQAVKLGSANTYLTISKCQ